MFIHILYIYRYLFNHWLRQSGTGTNACYLEKTKNINRLSDAEKQANDQVFYYT